MEYIWRRKRVYFDKNNALRSARNSYSNETKSVMCMMVYVCHHTLSQSRMLISKSSIHNTKNTHTHMYLCMKLFTAQHKAFVGFSSFSFSDLISFGSFLYWCRYLIYDFYSSTIRVCIRMAFFILLSPLLLLIISYFSTSHFCVRTKHNEFIFSSLFLLLCPDLLVQVESTSICMHKNMWELFSILCYFCFLVINAKILADCYRYHRELFDYIFLFGGSKGKNRFDKMIVSLLNSQHTINRSRQWW